MAHDVSPAYYAALDEATVALLRATSIRSPRDFLMDCGHCGRPFWVPGDTRSSQHRRWCSPRCLQLAYYHRRRRRSAA